MRGLFALAVTVLATLSLFNLAACQKKPNFVFILTDDQDIQFGTNPKEYTQYGSLEAMPATTKYLIDGGAYFDNFFVATPICCPSRTEFITGRYYHNIGAPSGSCMHINAEKNVFNVTASMFGILENAGYTTGVFGKVTNDQGGYFCGKELDAGMTTIGSPCDFNDFYSKEYFIKYPNGSKHIEHLPLAQTTYQTSQIGNRSLAWIKDVVENGDKPFYAYIGPHAPHFPATPAPWIQNDPFPTLTFPRTPNWNASSPDKHHFIRQNPPFNDEVATWETQHMKDRWSTLVSVDEIVVELMALLTKLNVLEDTYIFYSSDHGYKLGQWRVGTSKQSPYETDIRIPYMVRGPGIKAGAHYEQVSGNVDFTPTLLDLAGVEKPKFMDGKSLAPVFVTEENAYFKPLGKDQRDKYVADWRKEFLVEYKSVGTYWNDHSSIWVPSTTVYGKNGKGPRSPETNPTCKLGDGVGNGNCWYVDDESSNSWRALRILNETTNWVYVEFDHTWTWTAESIEFKELYDISKDPYQLKNLVSSVSKETLDELHQALAKYQLCKGNIAVPSNCV